MSTGATIGGILGGGVGAALGGNVVGGFALGSAVGGGIEGIIKRRQADSKTIDPSSAMQTSILNDITRRRRAMEAGTFFMPQQQQLMSMGAGAMNKAASVTGGNIGATISALRGINRGTGRNLNELYGQMLGAAGQMGQQEMAQVNQLYNQQFSIQSYDKQQALHDAMRTQQDAGANLNAYMADPKRTQGLVDGFKEWLAKRGGNAWTGAQQTYPVMQNPNTSNLYMQPGSIMNTLMPNAGYSPSPLKPQ